jgi:hypothetical protein
MTRTIISLTANCSVDAHAERLPRERLRCVLGMLSSLEVKVLRPT